MVKKNIVGCAIERKKSIRTFEKLKDIKRHQKKVINRNKTRKEFMIKVIICK